MRFVRPDTVRLTLKNGDWIEVKKELTVGEDRRFRAAGLKRLSGSPGSQSASVDVDWEAMALARVEAYLTDWSAKDANGKDVSVTPSAIRNLASEDFEEIDQAIQTHIEAMADEKKVTAGA